MVYDDFSLLVSVARGWKIDQAVEDPAHVIVLAYLRDYIEFNGRPPSPALLVVIAETDPELSAEDRAESVTVAKKVAAELTKKSPAMALLSRLKRTP